MRANGVPKAAEFMAELVALVERSEGSAPALGLVTELINENRGVVPEYGGVGELVTPFVAFTSVNRIRWSFQSVNECLGRSSRL